MPYDGNKMGDRSFTILASTACSVLVLLPTLGGIRSAFSNPPPHDEKTATPPELQSVQKTSPKARPMVVPSPRQDKKVLRKVEKPRLDLFGQEPPRIVLSVPTQDYSKGQKKIRPALGWSLGTWICGNLLGGAMLGSLFFSEGHPAALYFAVPMGSLVLLGANVFGPSIGHFYVGKSRTAWKFSMARLGLLTLFSITLSFSLVIFISDPEDGTDEEWKKYRKSMKTSKALLSIAVTSLLALYALSIWELVITPASVRRANRKSARKAGLIVAPFPMVVGDPITGKPGPGLGLAGSF